MATPIEAVGQSRILPALDTGRTAPVGSPQATARRSAEAIARRSAEEFEAVFLQTMVQEMMSGLGKDGPLGEGEAGGAWRSLLVQEYTGTMSRSGGISIADSLYPEILALQSTAAR
jgi:peptidoglycan hydrolase FlgJ